MKYILLLIAITSCSIPSIGQDYKTDISSAEKAIKAFPPDYAKAIVYYKLAKDKCPVEYISNLEIKIKETERLKAESEAIEYKKNNPTSVSIVPSTGKDNLLSPKVVASEKLYSPSSLFFSYVIVPPQKEQLLAGIMKLATGSARKDIKVDGNANTDVFFQIEENRLQGINRKIEARFLYDSTLHVINQSNNVSEQSLTLHLRATLHYGWDLLDRAATNAKMLDSATAVIQQTINISSNHQFNSAKSNYAFAGFENLLSNYYAVMEDNNNSYKHKLLAADYIRKAIWLEPNNIYYWGSLYIYTRNFKWLPDSILAKSEKNEFVLLSYNIADYMDKNIKNSFPATGSIMLSTKLQVLNDKYYELKAEKKYTEALSLLKNEINKNEVNAIYTPIFNVTVYNSISELYNQYIKNSTLYKEYTQKAANTLVYFLKNSSLSQYRWTGWFKDAFDNIASNFDNIASNSDFSFTENEKVVLYKSIVTAIQEGKDDYINNKNISYAYLYANSLLANMLVKEKSESGSVQALTFFANSIELFEQGKYLENYSTYSEDYAKYCKPYGQIIKLYVNQGNYIMAKKYYEAMMKYFSPIIAKYSFDFYLMQHIIWASEAHGQFLFKQKRYKEAIAPLELASYEGIKQSTEYLIEIYSKTAIKNQVLADSFIARNAIQSKNLKRFTVPVDCAGSKQPFYVYIMDRAKGHPYKGIQDQVLWLKEARGCDVPKDVVTSFNKLQNIAWENNVSFQDLCLYALGEKNTDSLSITKENDTKKDLTPQEEFNSKKKNINSLILGKKTETLIAYLRWYLLDMDIDRADSLLVIMLKNDELNTTDIRFYLKIIYTTNTKDKVSDKLLQYDTYNPKQIYYYSLIIGDTLLKTNNQKWANYLNIVALDSMYKLSINNDTLKTITANVYNSLGWQSLLTKRYNQAEHYLKKSIELNPRSPFAKGNLAHAYLLNNQYEKAKAEYLKLKDEPIKDDTRFKTFKDAFSDDFKEFEKEGIYNEYFKEIKRLLGE